MAMAVSLNRSMVGPMGPMGPSGEVEQSLIDYVDLLFNLMGVDIKYQEFKNMSNAEKTQFIRDLKIKKVMNEL